MTSISADKVVAENKRYFETNEPTVVDISQHLRCNERSSSGIPHELMNRQFLGG